MNCEITIECEHKDPVVIHTSFSVDKKIVFKDYDLCSHIINDSPLCYYFKPQKNAIEIRYTTNKITIHSEDITENNVYQLLQTLEEQLKEGLFEDHVIINKCYQHSHKLDNLILAAQESSSTAHTEKNSVDYLFDDIEQMMEGFGQEFKFSSLNGCLDLTLDQIEKTYRENTID